jgi:hypothetical protein
MARKPQNTGPVGGQLSDFKLMDASGGVGVRQKIGEMGSAIGAGPGGGTEGSGFSFMSPAQATQTGQANTSKALNFALNQRKV